MPKKEGGAGVLSSFFLLGNMTEKLHTSSLLTLMGLATMPLPAAGAAGKPISTWPDLCSSSNMVGEF